MALAVGTLVRKERVTEGHYLLALECPEIAAGAAPGQFVNVRVAAGYDPLLRRPFSVLRADPGLRQVWVLVKVVGRGTQMLAEREPGAKLELMGPLGKGWPEPAPEGDLVLVAGGVGVAPLIFWAERLQEAYRQSSVISLLGAATEGDLVCWLELAARSDEFYVATEDGSAGEPGLVTDLLEAHLAQRPVAAVYACGPTPMLASVARLAQEVEVPCYVAMEQRMACGVGACLGCVVPAAGGGYVRVCTEGPVFPAEAIDWEALVE